MAALRHNTASVLMEASSSHAQNEITASLCSGHTGTDKWDCCPHKSLNKQQLHLSAPLLNYMLLVQHLVAVITLELQFMPATADLVQSTTSYLASEVRVNALHISLSAIISQLHPKGLFNLNPNRSGHPL